MATEIRQLKRLIRRQLTHHLDRAAYGRLDFEAQASIKRFCRILFVGAKLQHLEATAGRDGLCLLYRPRANTITLLFWN
nr:hypothetical protein [Acidithiobacillus thiooxidans]